MHLLVVGADDRLIRQITPGCPGGWRLSLLDHREATAALALQRDFDVIICSLAGSPETAGEVLAHARDLRPEAVRVLSVPRDERAPSGQLARHAEAAQQLLYEPIDPAELRATVRRLLTTRSLMGDPDLRRLLGSVRQLPSPPGVYLTLKAACRDPDVSMRKVCEIVASDPGLATRTLRIANSAMYSRGRPIRNLDEAVARLGLHTLLHLVAASEVFPPSGPGAAAAGSRGLLASRIAHTIAPGDVSAELAGTAALLADLGELLPSEVIERLEDPRPDWRGLPRRSLFGACLLAIWGLPMELVEAVAYRRHPSRIERDRYGLVACVHVACALAAGDAPDLLEVEALGISQRLPSWQRIAERYRDALDGA